MNKIKKVAFGVLVAGLAFGFSAFKAMKTTTVFVYYKTDTDFAANDHRGYKYYSGDRCEPIGTICSAQWDIGTNPVPELDGEPLPSTGVTFQSGSVIPGSFD